MLSRFAILAANMLSRLIVAVSYAVKPVLLIGFSLVVALTLICLFYLVQPSIPYLSHVLALTVIQLTPIVQALCVGFSVPAILIALCVVVNACLHSESN